MKKLNLTLSGMLAIGICAVALTQSGAPELRKIDADPIDLSKVKIISSEQSSSVKKVKKRAVGETLDSISFNEVDYQSCYRFVGFESIELLSDGWRFSTNEEGEYVMMPYGTANYFDGWQNGSKYRCTFDFSADSDCEVYFAFANVVDNQFSVIDGYFGDNYSKEDGEREFIFEHRMPILFDNPNSGVPSLYFQVQNAQPNSEVTIRNVRIEHIETGYEGWGEGEMIVSDTWGDGASNPIPTSKVIIPGGLDKEMEWSWSQETNTITIPENSYGCELKIPLEGVTFRDDCFYRLDVEMCSTNTVGIIAYLCGGSDNGEDLLCSEMPYQSLGIWGELLPYENAVVSVPVGKGRPALEDGALHITLGYLPESDSSEIGLTIKKITLYSDYIDLSKYPEAVYDEETGEYKFEADGVTYYVNGFYDNIATLNGIKTDAESVDVPEYVVVDGKLQTIGAINSQRSDFYVNCPSLKTINAPKVKHIDFNVGVGCVLEAINVRQLESFGNDSFGREGQYGVVAIHSDLPHQNNSRNSSGGCARVLVGEETLDAPSEPNDVYFWTQDEYGSWIGYGVNNVSENLNEWNGIYVKYIFTDGKEAAIPSSVSFDNGMINWDVYQINNYYGLTGYAGNLTSIHIPLSMTDLNVRWNNTPIKNIYFEGEYEGNIPYSNYSLNSNYTVYASSERLYDDLFSRDEYRNATIVPYGWDFEPLVVEVKRRGEFAQTYIELTDADWSAGKVVKVIGSLSENDLKNMTNLTAVSTLDLSEADFDALPDSWMNGKTTLTKVVLPDFVTNIPNSAFNGCYALREVVCPSLAYVSNYAFNNCRNLESIDLSNVYYIGQYAFSYCNALTEVNTTDALSYIGSYAFRETGITRFDVPEKVTNLTDYVFYGCSALAEVSLPSSLVNIGAYTFASTAISGINVPEGVATIGDYCFNNCRNLENVALPSTLTDVGSYMFTNCTSLMNVDCKAITPPAVNYDMTSGVNLNRCTLRVAPFAIPEYRENSVWGKFLIVKPLNEPISNIVVERRMNFDLLSEDNDVLAGNPTMILKYNASKSRYGQLTAAGDGTLSAGQFTMWAYLGTRDGSMNYSASLINNAENMRADNVTLSMQVNKNYWHFFSLPFDVAMSDVTANEGTDFVIRRYDSERRAAQGETTTGNNWVDVLPEETLEAGQGYIIMAANNTTSASGGYYNAYVTFNSGNTLTKNNIFRSGNYIANLKEYPAEFAHNRSWNFIGNPYPCFYRLNNLMDDFYQPVTIWRGSSYQAYSPIDDDVVLRPFEAFFVQCPLETTEMAFSADGRMHVEEAFGLWATPGHRAPERINASERRVFNFNISGMGSDDRARIVINPDADRAYDAGDAAKMFADNSTSVEMYVADGVSYAICERPLDDAAATLGMKVAAKGQYTVSLDSRNADGWKVILIDNLTGNIVDLSAAPYVFDAEEGDFADRFTVRFEADGQGISSMIADDAEVAVFNLQGIKVYEGLIRDFNGDKGIYVVVCGENSFKIEL